MKGIKGGDGFFPAVEHGKILEAGSGVQPDMVSTVPAGAWVEPVAKSPSLVSPWRFRFLNEGHECDFPAAWNREEWGKLWLYNLHYFDCLAGDGRRKQQAELIGRWIADNPPGHGNGWEPYPLSLRIVNWIKWFLASGELAGEALESLAVQVRYLRKKLEFHLLGNHLFANGKTLIFAGLFFVGNEAEGWLAKGLAILRREIPDSGCASMLTVRCGAYNRGNDGHNAVAVDGCNQSEVWGAHRCGRWARPLAAGLEEKDDGSLVFHGAHDGYRCLPGGLVHRREIRWQGKIIRIDDLVDGAGRHRLSARLHVNPELSVVRRENVAVVELDSGRRLVVEPVGDVLLTLTEGLYCPEFGMFLPCPVLAWEVDAELPWRGGWQLAIEG